MAYRNFKFIDLETQFGIIQTTDSIFSLPIVLIEPTAHLLENIKIAEDSPLTTEKAVSEGLVYPILQEIRVRNRAFIELFSGENIDGDKTKGLNGECDYIIAKAPRAVELKAPILCVTEAKRGDIENPRSLSQAAAQLVGATYFNQKQGHATDVIFGACTSGFSWVFMKLEGKTLTIDTHRFSIRQLPELLGVLQNIIDLNRN